MEMTKPNFPCSNPKLFVEFDMPCDSLTSKAARMYFCCIASILAWNRYTYRQILDIIGTLVGNNIVDHSGIVWASPVGASTNYIFILDLTPGFSMDWAKATAGRDGKHLSFVIGATYIRGLTVGVLCNILLESNKNDLIPMYRRVYIY